MDLQQTTILFDEPVTENVQEEKAVAKKKPSVKKQKPQIVKAVGKRGRVKLTELDANAHLVSIPEDEELFSKSYYSMGAVAEMFKVNQSLIRAWENEFDILQPKKNGKGNRLFRPEDVKNLKLIYHLLRERKYTLEGAREFIKKNRNAEERFALVEELKKLKGFLNELKANL